ncbi:MAG TPA: HEAT repeat domain-containing protein [Planctomycetota bacterium]
MTALPALALLLALQATPEELAKQLGASDPAARLSAIKTIAADGHPQAEALCLKALGDEDWEVATIAARELGELVAVKAQKPLLDLALEGPVRGLRRAAGEALGRIDAPGSYEKLVKQLGGDAKVRACEAIAALGPGLEGKAAELKTKELERLLEERDAGARRAAARALVAVAGAQRPARLAPFLAHEDVALRAGVIETAGLTGDAALFEPLARELEKPGLSDLLARRLYATLRTLHLAHPEKKADFQAVLDGLAKSRTAAGHGARLLGLLAQERQGARALEPAEALAALQPHLAHAEAATRATAAAACGRIGSDEALDAAAKLAQDDPDARVRRIATGVVARARGAKHEGTRALLLARLGKDADARVRETAASYLGVRGTPDVIPVLEAALADADWRVMTSAAVALGKTEHEESGAALVALYQRGSGDWRVRASAVAGLTRLRARSAVPILIAALEDEETLVARTAYEFLCEIARQRLEPKPPVWTKWWEEHGPKVKLSVPEEVVERRKKLEYVRTPEELFAGTYVGIDVLVLQTRSGGDAIESVLEGMEIEHRRTTSGQVLSDGLHPQGVFVSNCPGEITTAEAERLSWFVRAGGALFGSCWALQETIEKIEPSLMRKLETRGEVLDDVAAFPTDVESRFLQGVFTTDGRPIYHLEGAHLIEVLDPEEVEVLIDSPPCAARYGGGNLAAWFRLGHGLVLDSANHFQGQGFSSASDVRSPEARMAWALDHFGLTYEKLRELRKEKWWSKTSATAEHVKDLSVFRLITNFVWLKRLAEE